MNYMNCLQGSLENNKLVYSACLSKKGNTSDIELVIKITLFALGLSITLHEDVFDS